MPVDLITPVTPTDPGAPTAPDPPTPHRLDELIAELALAEKWPTPAGWCSRCGLAPCISTYPSVGECDAGIHQVATLDSWAASASYDLTRSLGLPSWDIDRRVVDALVRALRARAA